MSPDATEDHMSDDVGFVLAVGSDEKLLRRLNDLDHCRKLVLLATKGRMPDGN